MTNIAKDIHFVELLQAGFIDAAYCKFPHPGRILNEVHHKCVSGPDLEHIGYLFRDYHLVGPSRVRNCKNCSVYQVALKVAPVIIAAYSFQYNSLDILVSFYDPCFCGKDLDMTNSGYLLGINSWVSLIKQSQTTD
jgi:hypothetical protein